MPIVAVQRTVLDQQWRYAQSIGTWEVSTNLRWSVARGTKISKEAICFPSSYGDLGKLLRSDRTTCHETPRKVGKLTERLAAFVFRRRRPLMWQLRAERRGRLDNWLRSGFTSVVGTASSEIGCPMNGNRPTEKSYPRPDLLIGAKQLARDDVSTEYAILDARPRTTYEAGHVPTARWSTKRREPRHSATVKMPRAGASESEPLESPRTRRWSSATTISARTPPVSVGAPVLARRRHAAAQLRLASMAQRRLSHPNPRA
jgi:hypothetical protein